MKRHKSLEHKDILAGRIGQGPVPADLDDVRSLGERNTDGQESSGNSGETHLELEWVTRGQRAGRSSGSVSEGRSNRLETVRNIVNISSEIDGDVDVPCSWCAGSKED